MIITKVISFRNAWPAVEKNNEMELAEVLRALNSFTIDFKNQISSHRPFKYDLGMFSFLKEHGWLQEQTIANFNSETPHIGPYKNDICIQLGFGESRDYLAWINESSQLACQSSIVRVPIAIIPTDGFEFSNSPGPFYKLSFNKILSEIKSKSPLHLNYPWLIIGVSSGNKKSVKIAVHDVEYTSDSVESILVEKLLEFPPELYEAGRGILAYFGTYLEEEYGDQKARVKIEQDDANKTLRMTVISESGDKKVVEKAYEEFKQIVSKQQLPEKYASTDSLVEKLYRQLDIMEVNFKGEIRARQMAEKREEDLIKLMGKSLDKTTPVTVYNINESSSRSLSESVSEADAISNAEAKTEVTVEVHQNLNLAIGGINELKELLDQRSPEAIELKHIQDGLRKLRKEKNPESETSLSIAGKLNGLLSDIASGEGKLAQVVRAAENGYSLFKKLATAYNKVAPWCMLPSVPEVFTSP